jgi:hypothetical protein
MLVIGGTALALICGPAGAATLAETLNATNLTWITGGDAPWFAQTTNTHDGVVAAQSGDIGDEQETWLETVVGPGPLSFWWKLSSEHEYDYLEFYVNGVFQSRFSGEVDWWQQTTTLAAATNILRWRYVKDISESDGADAGWLDEVSAMPILGPPTVVTPPLSRTNNQGTSAAFSALVTGSQPLSFQWLKNGTNLSNTTSVSGADQSTLTLSCVGFVDTGDYSVIVSNVSGSVTSAVASLTVLDPVILNQPANTVATLGESAALAVTVAGTLPLSYQWRKDGAALIGATNAVLTFSPVQPADLAEYDVVASNPYGSVTSAVAKLALPINPVLAGQWPGRPSGSARAVAVAGNYAYVAEASGGLQIIAVSNPASPVSVGGCVTSGEARDVAVLGPYAFVVGSTWMVSNYVGALEVIDVSQPENPVRVGRCDAGMGYLSGVAVSGNHAFVAGSMWTGSNYLDGLQVIDVSDPASPVRVGACAITGSVGKVAVSGNYAYVAGYDAGLQVVDVTDPHNPARVGDWEHWDTTDVAVSGNYAYVIYQTDYSTGLFAVDVSNPAMPVRMGNGCQFDGWAYGLTVRGNYAYVAAWDKRLQVIDVTNPANPVRVGGDSASGQACDVAVSGNYAFVADQGAGLQVISVTTPASPVRVGACLRGTAEQVAVSGTLAYLADGSAGLQVIDVSNPGHPTGLGTYVTTGYARDVAVSGNHVCVVHTRWTGSSYVETLEIIDAGDPANPRGSGTYEIADSSSGNVAISGDYAYLTGYWWTGTLGYFLALQVIDVSNPANPVRVGSFQTNGSAVAGLAVSGSHAFLGGSMWTNSTYVQGLHVIDVSNPANPLAVGGYPLTGQIVGVAVSGNYAFVTETDSHWTGSNWGGNLHILDVSNPANPVRVGIYEISQPGRVSVSGNYAYLGGSLWTESNFVRALQVLDVSNPANPVLVGRYNTRGSTAGVAGFGSHAYVADGAWGLAILQFPPTIHTGGAFGLAAGPFGFHFSGLSGQSVVIEASTNLTQWWPLQTNTLGSGALYFSQPDWGQWPLRFYRANLRP